MAFHTSRKWISSFYSLCIHMSLKLTCSWNSKYFIFTNIIDLLTVNSSHNSISLSWNYILILFLFSFFYIYIYILLSGCICSLWFFQTSLKKLLEKTPQNRKKNTCGFSSLSLHASSFTPNTWHSPVQLKDTPLQGKFLLEQIK